uniref:Uncharacterized protein n=2 Tax=Canis lupus familiaris TaxID=9615 RepID=A0A8I3NIV2_CANLF
ILLLHLLNGNVSSKNIDIKLSHSIFALRKNFEVIKFTRQVGYAKREMHGNELRSRSPPLLSFRMLHALLPA